MQNDWDALPESTDVNFKDESLALQTIYASPFVLLFMTADLTPYMPMLLNISNVYHSLFKSGKYTKFM